MKKVLILNTSHNDLRLILALKEMNFYVISIGGVAGLIGEKYVDEYIQQDYSNKEKVLDLARELKIDAICACCNDFGVITAAYVAEKMNLSGHDTYENALIMHHKDKFKEFAKIHKLNTPIAEYFEDRIDALNWLEDCNITYPLIVKPTDLSAGNGISKACSKIEAKKAIEKAFNTSRIKKIVIEPFIEGTQHACCTFLINKKVVAYCTNNEYSFINPYRVEIDTYPANNFESVKDILINEAEKMANILNLKDGILSMQYILKDGKPYIIEAMRRILGNLYMIPAEKLTQLNWDYWEARVHCGLNCSDFPKKITQQGFYAYRALMAKGNGYVKDIIIPNFIEKYVIERFMLWKQDTPIKNYMSEPLGFLFFQFSSQEEMEHVMLAQYDKIIISINEK